MEDILMELKNYSEGSMSVEKCFGNLFYLRDCIHLRHLRPTNPGQLGSGWEHKALNDFYDELIDMIDGLIESYQGKYGLLNIEIPSAKPGDAYSEIKKKVTDLEMYKDKLFKDSYILNQIDEMIMLMYQTLYKLKNLR